MEAPASSPSPEKGIYELFRDENVIRLQQMAALSLAARAELDAAKGNKSRSTSAMIGTGVQRRSSRRTGNPFRRGGEAEGGKRSPQMRSAKDSLSEATKSDDDAIAIGMMHLAIACTHVTRQSDAENKSAGSEEELMDSSEDDLDLEAEVPLLYKRMKRKNTTSLPHAADLRMGLPPLLHVAIEPSQPNLAWVPGHYMPIQLTARTAWTGGASTVISDVWAGQNVMAQNENFDDRNAQRKQKADYDLVSRQRALAGVKPNRVFVLSSGEVDTTCEGKNAWNEALRDLVPKCLDISVTNWSKHEPHTLQKLRAAFDNEFEYLGNPLSMVGFRLAMSRYLKAERCRLKTRYFKGIDTPPLHVDITEWDRLKEYWNTDKQKDKARKMAAARKSVKNLSSVGRRGKSGRKSSAGRVPETSSGMMDDGEGTISSARPKLACNEGGTADSSRWEAMESWRKDVDAKLEQFVATSTTTSTAVHELRSMFTTFMKNSAHGNERSPSGSDAEERRRGPIAKPRKKLGNWVTAQAADITLPEDEFRFNPSQATREIPLEAQVVDIECMPPHWKVTERVVNESFIEELMVSEPQVALQPQSEAVLDSKVDVDVPSLPASSTLSASKASHAEARIKTVAHSPEVRDNISIVEKPPVVDEDPARGERETGTVVTIGPSPDPSPAINADVAGQAQEKDSDAGIRARHGALSGTDVVEVSGERANVEEVASGTRLPSQKKSRKPLKSPLKVKGQKREARPRTASAAGKKAPIPASKVYSCGDEVFLTNPRAHKQKVAVGKISGLPEKHKYHGSDIPETWFKVDVYEILQEEVALMFPNDIAEQEVVKDAKGSCTMWSEKYLKLTE